MKRDIPSAGPWITQKEKDYVADAVANGWYENWSGYLDRFQEKVAALAGARFALATSSCTGALHIAMSALGIGPGDEVVVPESTWIATAACVCYLGARPVFVDLERDTWCMDPRAFAAAITARTKAVIPVHMYGHPADMDAINCIAKEHGIAVVEDAAPGIGSRYKDRPAGSLGLTATFSFHGAKPLVAGEGGCLVTSDENFFDRASWYADHCRKKGEMLVNDGIGYKYRMSNIQAALGLAQVERVEEIINKRRRIFFWYRDRLQDIPGLAMNVERPGCYNNFYVPTIILEGDFPISTSRLMEELTRRGINNRPFFRCISKFSMFESVVTPVADFLAARGINLPCPSLLSEDQADYVAENLRELLLG